jgi:hypothetical protein
MFTNRKTSDDRTKNASQARRRPTGAGRKASNLGVESLEGREMMAGNVWAAVNGGNLSITGDEASNGVEITQVGPTSFRVSGTPNAGATAVNGWFQPRTFTNVTGAIQVNLNGGNDVLRIGGTSEFTRNILPDDLNITTGTGNDVVNVQWLSNRDFNDRTRIDTGSGNDVVNLFKVVNRDFMNISTGSGSDSVVVSHVTVRTDLNIDTGSENDAMVVQNAVMNRLFARLGTGNDRATVQNNWFSTDAMVDGGDGLDSMSEFNNNRWVRRFSV